MRFKLFGFLIEKCDIPWCFNKIDIEVHRGDMKFEFCDKHLKRFEKGHKRRYPNTKIIDKRK